MPVTAIGKIFKPELRCMSIARVLNQAFMEEDLVVDFEVINDKKYGIGIDLQLSDNKGETIRVIKRLGLVLLESNEKMAESDTTF